VNPKTYQHPELLKKLPSEVKTLFKVFNSEILLVGGCVRDFLLQKNVNDFDFCTKFLPDEIIKILTKNKIKAIPTGIKFGTITAVVNGKNFEITTLRKDHETDGRYCNPEFVDDYSLDAARRDFTINALYLDSAGLVYDYFDGISDLKNSEVKFIGDAKKRIEEDFLRILRFFRFSCRYAKGLDNEGLKACVDLKENLKNLSRERIRSEILKIIDDGNKTKVIAILQILESEKIIDEIFAEKLDIEALKHLFEMEVSASLNLKLAVLFLKKDLDLKKFAQEICATNKEKKYFSFLVEKSPEPDLQSLKQLLAFSDKNWVLDFYLFTLAKSPKKNTDSKNIIHFLQNFFLPEFLLNGEDAKHLGLKDKAVGEAITKAKIFWAENNFTPDKNSLINFLKSSK
jgi:poly(A) polymerase